MKRVLSKVHYKNFVASLLLAIFSVYYVNSTMFGHVHTIDGATIVHSHFYVGSHNDCEDGGHTSSELTLIEHLSNITTLKSESLVIEEVCAEMEYQIFIPTTLGDVDIELYSQSTPRAPPQFFV